MKTKASILAILFLGYAIISTGQSTQKLNPDNTVIITLNHGSKLEGEVIEWDLGKSITIMTTWGKEYTLTSDKYQKVEQKNSIGVYDKHRPYNFRDKGIYYSFRMSSITGNNGNRATEVNGFGLNASAGLRFHRLLAVGAGVGYDKFIWQSGEEFIPVFAEVSGYLHPKLTSLFYNVQAGYSFAQGTEERYLLTSAEGGFMVHPSVGIRFGGDILKFTFDVGYKFQNANLIYAEPWTNGNFQAQRLRYQRLVLRLGVTI